MPMQKNNQIAFLLLICLVSISFALDETGYLSVTADDSMAINIDTTFVGTGNISYFTLPVGPHIVHVYNPNNRSWTHRGQTQHIEINRDQHTKVDFREKETIQIISLPYASKVYVGDELLGQTPLIYTRENIGGQSIRLENRGFEDKSFNLVQGQSVYKVPLQIAESQGKNRITRMKDNQYKIKWYREGLIVTSLAASWASFYYKREADRYYSQYQRSSDSRDMIALYSKTEHYDTMAEIAIAVSATTLGTYLFLLLIN
jgi:hypothetical protein